MESLASLKDQLFRRLTHKIRVRLRLGEQRRFRHCAQIKCIKRLLGTLMQLRTTLPLRAVASIRHNVHHGVPVGMESGERWHIFRYVPSTACATLLIDVQLWTLMYVLVSGLHWRKAHDRWLSLWAAITYLPQAADPNAQHAERALHIKVTGRGATRMAGGIRGGDRNVTQSCRTHS